MCSPEPLLHWDEFQTYAGEGIATYDFGGILHRGEPVSDFKLSFGGRIVAEWCSTYFGWRRLGKLMYRIADRAALRRLWNFPADGRPADGPPQIIKRLGARG
jgi:hypothetical protein